MQRCLRLSALRQACSFHYSLLLFSLCALLSSPPALPPTCRSCSPLRIARLDLPLSSCLLPALPRSHVMSDSPALLAPSSVLSLLPHFAALLLLLSDLLVCSVLLARPYCEIYSAPSSSPTPPCPCHLRACGCSCDCSSPFARLSHSLSRLLPALLYSPVLLAPQLLVRLLLSLHALLSSPPCPATCATATATAPLLSSPAMSDPPALLAPPSAWYW